MKRIMAMLLTVMLLAAVIPSASLAEVVSNSSVKNTVFRTTASTLHLRSGASTKKTKILAKLSRGTAVALLKSSGKWYKVRVLKSGKVGWVYGGYAAKGAYARVTTRDQGLNVHSGPGVRYRLKGSLPKGARNVLVQYVYSGWAYVKWGKLAGWVCVQGKYKYPLLTWNA